MAAEVLAEAQRRMQEVKDAKEATKQAASRKRQLKSALVTASSNSRRQQKTLDEVYASKSKDEVDAAVADSSTLLACSSTPLRTFSSGPCCKLWAPLAQPTSPQADPDYAQHCWMR